MASNWQIVKFAWVNRSYIWEKIKKDFYEDYYHFDLIDQTLNKLSTVDEDLPEPKGRAIEALPDALEAAGLPPSDTPVVDPYYQPRVTAEPDPLLAPKRTRKAPTKKVPTKKVPAKKAPTKKPVPKKTTRKK